MKTERLITMLVSTLFTINLYSCGTDSDMSRVITPEDNGQADKKENIYYNPVIQYSAPDPTVIRAKDGYFYLYATEDTYNIPVYRSSNLVDWTQVSTAFTDATRPKWDANLHLWAPDINYINGQYVLYYSDGHWGDENTSGIGVAYSDKPEGPFIDHGKLFISTDIGVQNSIDQCFVEDNGKNYLFWGSFRGIYAIELTADGLDVKPGAQKVQVSGTFMEGTMIWKKDGYYYMFGSNGSCCEGANSTYRVTIGRSKDLLGPYVTKEGKTLLGGNYDVLLSGNDFVAGPGHNAEIITDDAGQDWIIYHGYERSIPDRGRQVFLSQILWKDGWPYIEGGTPVVSHKRPVFNTK